MSRVIRFKVTAEHEDGTTTDFTITNEDKPVPERPQGSYRGTFSAIAQQAEIDLYKRMVRDFQ
jgi:hypothetical protein